MNEHNTTAYNLCQSAWSHQSCEYFVSAVSSNENHSASTKLLKTVLKHAGSELSLDRSFKLKTLLEKRVTESHHDPYAFKDTEIKDGSGISVRDVKELGFERLQDYPTTNGCQTFIMEEKADFTVVQSPVQNDENFLVDAVQPRDVAAFELGFNTDGTYRHSLERNKGPLSTQALPRMGKPTKNFERTIEQIKTEKACISLAEGIASAAENDHTSISRFKNSTVVSSGLTPNFFTIPGRLDSCVATPCTSTISKKREPLQFMWNLRSKIKRFKRNYEENLGPIIGEKESHFSSNGDEKILIQKHWFPLCHDYHSFTGSAHKRETKLTQLKSELRHKLIQCQWRHRDRFEKEMGRLLLNCARRRPNLAAFIIHFGHPSRDLKSRPRWYSVASEIKCNFKGLAKGEACRKPVLPGATHCFQHVVHHTSQQLFSACTACNSAATGRLNPVCSYHQQKLGFAPFLANGAKSSKRLHSRRYRSSNASYRSRKRKRQHVKEQGKSRKDDGDVAPPAYAVEKCLKFTKEGEELREEEEEEEEDDDDDDGDDDDEREGNTSNDLTLDSADLATLANHSLEEHDLSHVLNHISPEAFNDLFTDKYETESEELERALEAVNNETLTILNMLDPETLAVLPEIMQLPSSNGPIEQSICENTVFIPHHADILKS